MADAVESTPSKSVCLVSSRNYDGDADSLRASRAESEVTHSSSAHRVIGSDTGQSQFAISGDALPGHSSTNSKTPKRSISSNLFLGDRLKGDISKASSLTSEPTGFNSESSNVTAAKRSSSDVTNKQTMCWWSSSIPSTTDGPIGTSTAENNKSSGNPIGQPFRTNKKSSGRALAKITRQSLPSLVNTIDTSDIKTSLKMDNLKSSSRLQVPEYKASTVSPSKKSTSLSVHLESSGLAKKPNESDLEDEHSSKLSDYSFSKKSSRSEDVNAQSQADRFPKDGKNNFAYLNKHSNTVSKTHARYSTRNFCSQSMGRTKKSPDDYSQTATHSGNDSPFVYSPITSKSSRSSKNNFTSNEGHSPNALHDDTEAISSESHSSCGILHSNNRLKLCATSDFSRDSDKECESKFRYSPRDSRFELKLSREYSHTALEDVFSDIGCSLNNLNSHASKSAESYEESCQYPNALDVISQPECIPKALCSPIGSKRRGRFYKRHSRTRIFQDTNVTDDLQSTKPFKASKSNDLDQSLTGDSSSSLEKKCESSTEHSSANSVSTDVKPRSKNIKSFTNFPPIWSPIKASDIRDISTSNLLKKDKKFDLCDVSNPYLEETIPSSSNSFPQHRQDGSHVSQVWPSRLMFPEQRQNESHSAQKDMNEPSASLLSMAEPSASLPSMAEPSASLLNMTEPSAPLPSMDEPSASLPSMEEHTISKLSLNEPPVSEPSISEPPFPHPFVEEPNAPQLYQYAYSTIYIPPLWRDRPYVLQLPPGTRYAPQNPPPVRPFVPHLPPPVRPFVPIPPPTWPYLPHLPPPYVPHVPPPTWPHVPHLPPPSRLNVSRLQLSTTTVFNCRVNRPYVQRPPRGRPHVSQVPSPGRPHVSQLPSQARPHVSQVPSPTRTQAP